ncbi:hypothetical protein L1049_021874 [Liquidambar formosana]|uniref:Uncharacterized protein n=1 Tax=Liquidambar formosana TaxID=63359 RepID=A0AAP0RBK7_LIQFO
MHPQNKAFILILLLLFNCSFSGKADGFNDDVEVLDPSGEVIFQMKGRKLVGVDVTLDYRTGANPAHDPKPPAAKGGN